MTAASLVIINWLSRFLSATVSGFVALVTQVSVLIAGGAIVLLTWSQCYNDNLNAYLHHDLLSITLSRWHVDATFFLHDSAMLSYERELLWTHRDLDVKAKTAELSPGSNAQFHVGPPYCGLRFWAVSQPQLTSRPVHIFVVSIDHLAMFLAAAAVSVAGYLIRIYFSPPSNRGRGFWAKSTAADNAPAWDKPRWGVTPLQFYSISFAFLVRFMLYGASLYSRQLHLQLSVPRVLDKIVSFPLCYSLLDGPTNTVKSYVVFVAGWLAGAIVMGLFIAAVCQWARRIYDVLLSPLQRQTADSLQ